MRSCTQMVISQKVRGVCKCSCFKYEIRWQCASWNIKYAVFLKHFIGFHLFKLLPYSRLLWPFVSFRDLVFPFQTYSKHAFHLPTEVILIIFNWDTLCINYLRLSVVHIGFLYFYSSRLVFAKFLVWPYILKDVVYVAYISFLDIFQSQYWFYFD